MTALPEGEPRGALQNPALPLGELPAQPAERATRRYCAAYQLLVAAVEAAARLCEDILPGGFAYVDSENEVYRP